MFPCINTWKHPYLPFSDTIFRMKSLNYLLIALIFLLISVIFVIISSDKKGNIYLIRSRIKQITILPTQANNSLIPTTPSLNPVPSSKILVNNYYAKQTFNNCGPASLSMALSYYGINVSQKVLGDSLRPYQHPTGNNDDKSVTLDELAQEAQKYGLVAYHKPNGDIELIKQFITYDFPVITRTWLDTDDDIGHFRVVKGFDESKQSIVQDDSYNGPNLSYTYDAFNRLWEKFDYEYLVLVPDDKRKIAETIIGMNMDEKYAWSQTVKRNEKKLSQNPADIYARFNLSVAYYHLEEYQRSVDEFEKVENQLPFRKLWYQREPIEAYFRLKDYEKVLSITDRIINNHNLAYSELYILRGRIFQEQGNFKKAEEEYQKAITYNKNLREGYDLLTNIKNMR